MKRTCHGCRALGQPGVEFVCAIGKQIHTKMRHFGGPGEYLYTPVPAEECPKPRTYKQYMEESAPKKEPTEKKRRCKSRRHWTREIQCVLGSGHPGDHRVHLGGGVTARWPKK